VTYEGDVVLKGDDVLEIENATLILRGVLLVKDNARLILRNAELFVEKKRSWSTSDLLPFPLQIAFNNSARFEFYNSSISSRYPAIGFLGNSTAIIESSILTYTTIHGDDCSTIQIRDSDIYGISVADRSQCFTTNSKIGGISCQPIRRRFIYRRTMEFPFVDCRVEVRNSTLDLITIVIRNATAKVDKPIRGFHRYWNTYYDLSVDGVVLNLTLHNTRVTRGLIILASGSELGVRDRDDVYAVHIEKGIARFTNSSTFHLSCYDGSVLNLEKCVFEFVILTGDAEINIADSRVGDLYLEDFKGKLLLNRALIGNITLNNCETYLSGSVEFRCGPSTMRDWPWVKGIVTRCFDVYAVSEGRALPGVKLSLYDEEGEIAWSGETGRDGSASFNITFCKLWSPELFTYVTNYNDTWRLEARWRGVVFNVSIGLLTDTLIIITFPRSARPIWSERWLYIAVGLSMVALLSTGFIYRHLTKPR